MSETDWLAVAKKASASKDAFETFYHELPGKVRQLLKHMDPRAKSQRNIEKELSKFSEDEVKAMQSMLKYHQALPLNHKYPKPRHQSKYKGKTKNNNHMISKDHMKLFNKRD